MNNTFNMKRFGTYLTADIRSGISNYGLSLMLISLMGAIIYTGTVIMGLIFKGTWGGPDIYFRATTFFICMIILMITMPVKCYGKITDKKYGSTWLMIPASATEKFLSMIITTIFIAPAVSAGIYLGLDALICAADSTCGQSLIVSFSNLIGEILEFSGSIGTGEADLPAFADFIRQVTCPWLYIDDFIMISLAFLLGAVIFKNAKIVKTYLSVTLIVSVIGMILITILPEIFSGIEWTDPHSPENLNHMFNSAIFRHAALADTLNDTLVNLALMTGIYFRIKTMKH